MFQYFPAFVETCQPSIRWQETVSIISMVTCIFPLASVRGSWSTMGLLNLVSAPAGRAYLGIQPFMSASVSKRYQIELTSTRTDLSVTFFWIVNERWKCLVSTKTVSKSFTQFNNSSSRQSNTFPRRAFTVASISAPAAEQTGRRGLWDAQKRK